MTRGWTSSTARPDAATRRRVAEHLAVCATCREEIAALGSLRQDLRSWTLPALDRPVVPSFPRRFLRALPTAAVLLLGLGGAFGLAGSEIRYDGGRLSVRLGRPGLDYQKALAEQEARALVREQELQEQVQALKAAASDRGPRDRQAPRDLLAHVEQLIRDSEARQAQQIQTNLARLGQRTEAQRRYDLARVAASLAYLDGRNGQQVARTTELMGYVLEASHNKR